MLDWWASYMDGSSWADGLAIGLDPFRLVG